MVAFLAAVGAGVAAGPACELVLGDLPPVQSTSGTTSGAGGSTSAGSSKAVASSSNASTSSSATTATTATSGTGGGPCCDCDNDHFDAEGMCGGKDCDDHDRLVYPGEPIYYGVPAQNPAIGFDYDCSGTADPNPLLDKTVNCGVLALPCTAATGYLAQVPPACGASAPWGTCKQQGITCVNDVIEQAKIMTCK
jgi:hypothetical protein